MGWNDAAGELEARLQEIQLRIQHAQTILLAAHIRPDGDAIGSVIGFGLALERVGKNVQMVLPTGIPASFRHLAGSERIQRGARLPVDMIIFLDCADQDRAGPMLKDSGRSGFEYRSSRNQYSLRKDKPGRASGCRNHRNPGAYSAPTGAAAGSRYRCGAPDRFDHGYHRIPHHLNDA
jgi:hypothetical protein